MAAAGNAGVSDQKQTGAPTAGPAAPRAGGVVFAQIEPTTRCNFICGFCSGRQMDQSDFAVEDFDRLLDTFPDLEHIELQGEGEPLLHKGFFDMARQARARGINLSMITNGSLLSKARVAALLDVGMAAINVSIESPEEAGFKKIRGGSLKKVKAGIARLLAARNARGLETPQVGFSITVLKHTIDTLPAVADLYYELGMDGGATIQPLNRMDSYTGVYDRDVMAQLLEPEDGRRLSALISGTPKLQAMIRAAQQSRHFYPEMSRRFRPLHGCPWVKGGVYVDRHGGITTCCMVKDPAAHGLGKLGLTPLEVIVAKRQEVDRGLTTGDLPEQCVGCAYYRTPERQAALNRRAEERRRMAAASARE